MPDSIIKKVEVFAAWDRARMGINFRNINHEDYEWGNEQYITPEAKAENAPFPDVPTEFPGIELFKDQPMAVVREDEAENIDDNDKATAAEANCELGELPKQNENEVALEEDGLQMDPDEHEHVEVVDSPSAQEPNPEEIVDIQEEEHSTIPAVGQQNAQDEEDTRVILEDDEDYRITEVYHGDRTRNRNHKYINPDIVNAVIADKELSKVQLREC